mgnify:CR=1 FL=1
MGRWPQAILQFEDFSTNNAFNLLERYRYHHTMFNDDIQGTAATALAGIYGALRVQGKPPSAIVETKFVIAGAGSAGCGVANQLQKAMVKHGATPRQAYRNFYMIDVEGLITADKPNLPEYLAPFARTVRCGGQEEGDRQEEEGEEEEEEEGKEEEEEGEEEEKDDDEKNKSEKKTGQNSTAIC